MIVMIPADLATSSAASRGHKLPVKGDIRMAIGKQAGDTVTVCALERLDGPARFA